MGNRNADVFHSLTDILLVCIVMPCALAWDSVCYYLSLESGYENLNGEVKNREV